MMQWERGVAPALLEREGDAIARAFVARRRKSASYRFQWPRRNHQLLYKTVHAALVERMANHCCYCDGHPIAAQGVSSVDHFRPKSRPEFHALVCTWSNLFLSCSGCNQAKGEKWDDVLLHGDAADYRFERYFEYRADTGALESSSAASPEEQRRARITIEFLDLNRPDLCVARTRAMRLMRKADVDELFDFGYRFLIPLCRPGP